MKKNKPVLSNKDLCFVCEDECEYEYDIYSCPKLQELIEHKKVVYIWSWVLKESP